MTNIINGIDVSECEFQNGCIEYKDISYLKVMPICAIYKLSIACHNKENKCKYYQVYKQLKRLQEENEELKNRQITKNGFICDCEQNAKYKQALEEIREIANYEIKELTDSAVYGGRYFEIYNKINEVLNDRN